MGLYIQMHSMHGLFRSQNLELGRDEDTGGQIIYVLELAKALGEMDSIDRVDIITRRIIDPEYQGYSKKVEAVSPKVNIVRIECGPKGYIKKVDLWPYLDEFVSNVKKYIRKLKINPDILQSNYADSGIVCSILSKEMNIPQVHTGHSLGIPKMRKLKVNRSNIKKFNKVFHFNRRLKAEKEVINTASRIISSTQEEIKSQYSGYKIKKHLSKFRVIPPGIDLKKFHPPEKHKSGNGNGTWQILRNVIEQGLKHPERAVVSVLSRLDKRKNLVGLLKAFACDPALRGMANLVVFAKTLEGNDETQKIIDSMNRIIRKHNLYDNIAMPGIHLEYEKQVPEYYRFLAKNRGIFVNPALIEPFGLTILEAGACGVPVVATKHGGPSEIIKDGVNGMLIDPRDPKDISKKLKKLIRHRDIYRKISKNSIRIVSKKYTWKASAKRYLRVFKGALKDKKCRKKKNT